MHDVLHVGNIQASGRRVGSDQKGIFSGRESLDVFETLSLSHGSVERKRRTLQHDEQRNDASNAVDTVAEHDRASGILLEEVEKIRVFFVQRAVQPVKNNYNSIQHADKMGNLDDKITRKNYNNLEF